MERARREASAAGDSRGEGSPEGRGRPGAPRRARHCGAGARCRPAPTDQRLLDTRGPGDWVHSDPWRVLRIQAEFVEGFGALAELRPGRQRVRVGPHGGRRLGRSTSRGRLGARPGRAPGFAVITGGGPGVMEAANQGALEAGGVSVGTGHRAAVRAGPQRLRRPRRRTSATSSSARRCS